MKQKNPPITSALVAINIAIFVFSLFAVEQGDQIHNLFKLYAPGVFSGEWWRLLSATFLHGGPLHVGLNMFVLWQLGSVAENLFGRSRYLAIYFGAGLLGNGLSVLSRAFLVDSLFIPSVGASGAIFGVAGALVGNIWIQVRTREDFLRHPFVKNIGFNILILFAVSFLGLLPLDNYAHAGGLIGGTAIAVLLSTARGRKKASKEKFRLALLLFVLLSAGTIYSLYPVGSPGFTLAAKEQIFQKGVDAFEQKDYVSAKKAFLQLKNEKPIDISSQYNLALCYYNLGEREQGIKELEELEKILAGRPGLETRGVTVQIVREMLHEWKHPGQIPVKKPKTTSPSE